MRLIVLALLLALALGSAHAYPLQGGNENVTAVLFGAVRTSLGVENATQEVLRLDASLIGAENATYELFNDTDYVFQPFLYKSLDSSKPGSQMQRHILFFLIPKDDLFKFIKITPSAGKPFNVKWWETPKGINSDLIIRYYGISDWIADPDQQGLVVQLRLGNNGTSDLPIGPENFTLLDQWGWSYYPVAGFESMALEPGNATGRVLVGFVGLSPLSRPAALAYDYRAPNQIIIDLEKDQGPLSDAKAYGENATQMTTPAATSAAAEHIAPAASPATVGAINQPEDLSSQQNATSAAGDQAKLSQEKGNTTARMSSLKEQIAASKAKLEIARADLKKNNTTQ